MIGIIDYSAGNIRSICNVLEYLNQDYIIINSGDEKRRIDKLIFPGVGSFGYCMKQLNQSGIDKYIRKSINKNIPFLGICLGYQVLFSESEESPGVSGLDILSGKVIKYTSGKIPQIGWNEVKPIDNNLFEEGDMYFVNSYYPVPEDDIISTTTKYGNTFASSIISKNIIACQFHPEKSGELGIAFLRRWLSC